MKLSEKMLAALAALPHVKKVWVKGDDYHLTAHAGWEEVEVNGGTPKERTYVDMELKELRDLCNDRKIPYDKKDKEPALIALLEAWDADPNRVLD